MSAPAVAGETSGRDRFAGAASVEILERSGGRIEVSGALTFATARRARQEGLRVLSTANAVGGVIEIDCAGVTASDSAGLTVLLDWLACAKRIRQKLKFSNVPAPIVAVAKISGVEDLLLTSA